jgi:hypothetical protein
MALQTKEVNEVAGGLKKKFAEESIDTMMDLVQRYQYQYPIKSTIRELASNAVDAIKERDVAIAILNGEPEENYYLHSDEPEKLASNFNRSYYNLDWLSTDPVVKIIYEESKLEKDLVRIIDPGVGLGDKRLEKYFELGASTKRNSKWSLGKFGIGGKSPLSTGVPFYQMKTRYNGKEFHFNIYSYKIESVVPPFELATGKPNESYTFEGGYVAYYKDTKEKNGTEIIMETKKFKKEEFLDAVKSQLLYFDNIELYLKKENGTLEQIPTKAKVLFENDLIVISDNKQFSKPHIILDKVNYGYVNFDELSLEDKTGNIGIKVNPAEVTVNPSRESLVWDETTKATVLSRFKSAKGAATKLVSDSLDNPDLIKWLKLYLSVRGKEHNSDDALSQLAGIVDLSSINPVFKYDPTLGTANLQLLFPGMRVQKVLIETVADKNKDENGKAKKRKVLKYKNVESITDMSASAQIVITDFKPEPRELKYIWSVYGEFYLINYEIEEYTQGRLEYLKTNNVSDLELGPLGNLSEKTITDTLSKRRKRVVKRLEESYEAMKLKDVHVPEDWALVNEEVDIDFVEDWALVQSQSLEERRKLEQRIVARTPRYSYANSSNVEWQKVEPKLRTALAWDKNKTYYGFEDDKQLIGLASKLTRNLELHQPKAFNGGSRPEREEEEELGLQNASNYSYQNVLSYSDTQKLKLIEIAKPLGKTFKEFNHISSFFFKVEGSKLTADPLLIKWFTAHKIVELIEDYTFLTNYKRIDRKVSLRYDMLIDYLREHYRSITSSSTLKEMLAVLEKMALIQHMKLDGASDSEIKTITLEAFGQEFTDVEIIDYDLYTQAVELSEYAKPLSTVLSNLETLEDGTFSEELEHEIKFYISKKGL